MIKDWKERYYGFHVLAFDISCGLIKDWKERYLVDPPYGMLGSCGLIKDWKERYFDKSHIEDISVVV